MTTTTETSGTDTDTGAPEATETHHAPAERKVLEVTPDEIKAFAGIGVLAAVWIGAIVLFGFPAVIVGALIMVVVLMAVLMIISRG